MSTKWPHSSLFRCSLFVLAKYVSSDLVLPENFGLLVPLLLYPPSMIALEFVLDGDTDDEEEVVSDADVLLCDDVK
eukprot:CAMPEP_0116084340 /NCGR_PEP_ID=MMETSP0327-20121206/3752_1 /TAXON_ID=44447 /ORGANISM="Pseudo-nitzschia delicatissima, Strain B596" /LENGTH=75 /DNA_ID=CAMNT_0003575283 /DNA_START=235 /DNA_END=462 /DNA_ORIENTATION=-